MNPEDTVNPEDAHASHGSLPPVAVDGVDLTAGVTAPGGFRAAGHDAGIASGQRADVALVVNDGPNFDAAGLFTRNAVKAAPVLWSEQVLSVPSLRAVVLNAGIANAATGPPGFQDAHATAERAAELLQVGAIDIAVCSTGLIGHRLPMPELLAGLEHCVAGLGSGAESGTAAAEAVLTTDTRAKQAGITGRGGWSLGGFAKGAGMLAPDMATMLSVITTDAALGADALDAALRAAVRHSFDRLDVDGGTSTSDTVLLLSSGAAQVSPPVEEFTEALSAVSLSLTRQLQADAEGATKLIDITVRAASTEDEAVEVARTVAEDNLVNTAIFGSDPNWGRIAMAVGRSRATVDPDKLSISVNGVELLAGGVPARDRSEVDLAGVRVLLDIDLGLGAADATVYSTDLSHGYVEENSAYTT